MCGRPHLCNFQDTGFDLRRKRWNGVIGLKGMSIWRQRRKKNTYVSSEFHRVPSQKHLEPTASGVKEIVIGIFDSGWEIVTGEVIENVDEEHHALCYLCVVCLRGRNELLGCGLEQREERLHELGEDDIDFGEEFVRSHLGPPVSEDGMSGLEHANVDIVICGRKGRHKLLERR